MNLAVVAIIALTAALIAGVVAARVRSRLVTKEPTTVERRSGEDRRRRKVRVAVDRRRRARRTEDVARKFVDRLSA